MTGNVGDERKKSRRKAENSEFDGCASLMYDIELEKNILGSFMTASFLQIQRFRENVRADDFYSTFNQRLYTLISQLNDRGEDVNLMTVVSEYRKSDANPPIRELADISTFVLPSLIEVPKYIEILLEYSRRRKLWFTAQQMLAASKTTGESMDNVIDMCRDMLNDMPTTSNKKENDLADVLKEIDDIVFDNEQGNSEKRKTNTGFEYLDNKGGLQETDLIIIGAQSSQGKTSFALSILKNVILSGNKTAFYTMEMTNAQLVSRIVASISGVPSNILMTRKLDTEQKEKYQSSIEQLYKIKENMLFDTREVFSISEICNSIRRMKENHPELKGVVIDYLQLIQGQAHGEMREHFVGRTARTLKNLAKGLHIWIIALSQINRDNSNPIPTINRLRDSGQVEEAADMVLLIYRPEYYNTTQGMHLKFPPPYENENVEGRAVIIIGKGRRTGIGSFICKFDAPTTTFSTDDRFVTWVNKDKEVMDNSDLADREEKNNDMPF